MLCDARERLPVVVGRCHEVVLLDTGLRGLVASCDNQRPIVKDTLDIVEVSETKVSDCNGFC